MDQHKKENLLGLCAVRLIGLKLNQSLEDSVRINIITTCNININVIATVRSSELKYRHAAWCQMFFTDVI